MSTGAPGKQVDFFVSYTGMDEAWATWVAEVLEAVGRTTVVQAWDSPVGENFVTWISEQMDAADRTVAICSDAYFASHWCTQEWAGALAGRKLTPLRVAACRIPSVLATITYRDLFGVDEVTARRRLLEAVGLAHPDRVSEGFPGGAASPVFPGGPTPVGEVPPARLEVSGTDLASSRTGSESQRRRRLLSRSRHTLERHPKRYEDGVYQSVLGSAGRVTGRIAKGLVGEVRLNVRGSTETFLAYSSDPCGEILEGSRVIVVDYQLPRTVFVRTLPDRGNVEDQRS